jgi:Tol biopolymer transport system component
MSASDRFERDFGAVLADYIEPRYPDYFDDALERAIRGTRRPAWAFLERWLPMSAIALPHTRGMPRLWRTAAILALLLILLAAALTIGSHRNVPSPFGIAGNGSIAYARNGDLYIRPIGGPERPAVSGPENDVFAQFSRDGTQLTFIRLDDSDSDTSETLMIANADGSGVRKLLATHRLETFSWSPDSKEMAVVAEIGGEESLFLVPADGQAPRKVDMPVIPQPFIEWRPPDGRQLVLLGRSRPYGYSAFFTLDAGSATPVRVSELRTTDYWAGPWAISPDGRHVAVSVNTGRQLLQEVLDLDSGVAGPMFPNLPAPAVDTGFGPVHSGHGVYSPDGKWVVFGRYWDDRDDTLLHQLWRASADGDGSDATPVLPAIRSQGGVMPFGMLYSPDATRLMIQVFPEHKVYMIDAATGKAEPLDWVVGEDPPGWQRLPR